MSEISDDGVPLDDLEGVDTCAERYVEARKSNRIKRELHDAGIVLRPSDLMYGWTCLRRGLMCYASSKKEAQIRMDATDVVKSRRVPSYRRDEPRGEGF